MMIRADASELRITIFSDGLEIEGNTEAADKMAQAVFGPGPWRIASSDSQYVEAVKQCKALVDNGATLVHQFGESIARYCQPWPKELTPREKELASDTFELPKPLVYICTAVIAFGLVAIGYIVGVVAS
jgi:hypothetical protein